MKPSAATIQLERLSGFAGVWNTEGEIKAGPSVQSAKFTAVDTYEWLPGGHFLLHRFDSDMPEGRVQGIEIIGYSPESDSHPMRTFDNLGKENLMQARLDNDTWTFIGEGVRFTGGFREGGKVFAGLWELRPDGGVAWQPWMNIKLSKVE